MYRTPCIHAGKQDSSSIEFGDVSPESEAENPQGHETCGILGSPESGSAAWDVCDKQSLTASRNEAICPIEILRTLGSGDAGAGLVPPPWGYASGGDEPHPYRRTVRRDPGSLTGTRTGGAENLWNPRKESPVPEFS